MPPNEDVKIDGGAAGKPLEASPLEEKKGEAPIGKESEIRVDNGDDMEQESPEDKDLGEDDKEDQKEVPGKPEDAGEVQHVEDTAPDAGDLAIIKAKLEIIKKNFAEKGELFEDPEFPATDASLYKDATNLPEYTKECPIVDWKRPNEIVEVSFFQIRNY